MDLGFWRDVSVVVLVIEAFVLTLIGGVITYFVARGVTYLLQEIPKGFLQVRDILAQVQEVVVQITDRAISPVLAVSQFIARLKGIGAGISRQFGIRQN